jgi:hypothetical protein
MGTRRLWMKGFYSMGDVGCVGILRFAQDDGKNKQLQQQQQQHVQVQRQQQQQQQQQQQLQLQKQNAGVLRFAQDDR